MPSCDWPRGSGMLNPNTPASIASVLDSGIEQLELWVGLDGAQPAIENYLRSLADPCIQVIHCPKTSDSGNTQRHLLMERMRDQGVKGAFCFHDDDDAYLEGGLKQMLELCEQHGGVPVLARHIRALLDEIETPEHVQYATGIRHKFHIPISFAASVWPIMEGMPLWPKGGGYYDDLPYANELVTWFEKQGKQVMLLDRIVARLRPTDLIGSGIPEFHAR
jgi:hypothetical protein